MHPHGAKASYAVDCRPFHTKAGKISWEDSSLRGWLNYEFYSIAFSLSEQQRILASDTGEKTKDSVFLLTSGEANEYWDYLADFEYTDYARSMAEEQGEKVYSQREGYWWLLSHGSKGGKSEDRKVCAWTEGVQPYGHAVEHVNGGVRPVIRITTDHTDIQSSASGNDPSGTAGQSDFRCFLQSDGTVKITKYSGNAETLQIPSELDGVPVTAIGDSTFSGCESLVSLIVPDGVTAIGDSAFKDCKNLASVTMPDSIVFIGNFAFEDCYNLASFTVPGGVTEISRGTFYHCFHLRSVTIPDSVTKIGDRAFYNSRKLTTVTLLDGVESIGVGVFSSNPIASVAIPGSVTSIGEEAFERCYFLTSVTISDGVGSIGNSAFRNCKRLTSVTVPGSVSSIGNEAFYGCPELMMTVPAASYAEKFADNHKIPYSYSE